MWQPIKTIPDNGGMYFVIGDTEMAVAWFEPEAGAKWKLTNIPGGAVRLGHSLSGFHSWCKFSDLHRSINVILHPEYY